MAWPSRRRPSFAGVGWPDRRASAIGLGGLRHRPLGHLRPISQSVSIGAGRGQQQNIRRRRRSTKPSGQAHRQRQLRPADWHWLERATRRQVTPPQPRPGGREHPRSGQRCPATIGHQISRASAPTSASVRAARYTCCEPTRRLAIDRRRYASPDGEPACRAPRSCRPASRHCQTDGQPQQRLQRGRGQPSSDRTSPAANPATDSSSVAADRRAGPVVHSRPSSISPTQPDRIEPPGEPIADRARRASRRARSHHSASPSAIMADQSPGERRSAAPRGPGPRRSCAASVNSARPARKWASAAATRDRSSWNSNPISTCSRQTPRMASQRLRTACGSRALPDASHRDNHKSGRHLRRANAVPTSGSQRHGREQS